MCFRSWQQIPVALLAAAQPDGQPAVPDQIHLPHSSAFNQYTTGKWEYQVCSFSRGSVSMRKVERTTIPESKAYAQPDVHPDASSSALLPKCRSLINEIECRLGTVVGFLYLYTSSSLSSERNRFIQLGGSLTDIDTPNLLFFSAPSTSTLKNVFKTFSATESKIVTRALCFPARPHEPPTKTLTATTPASHAKHTSTSVRRSLCQRDVARIHLPADSATANHPRLRCPKSLLG